MVLVPDMVRYWQHKYQSDQKNLWWGRAKCKQSLLQNWRTCTLRVLVNYYSSITFYRVFFFSEWSVRKNVSISSKNWLIVCFPLCGISLKGAGCIITDHSETGLFTQVLWDPEKYCHCITHYHCKYCHGFLTHVALQPSQAEPKSLLWNKGILYDGHMLTW